MSYHILKWLLTKLLWNFFTSLNSSKHNKILTGVLTYSNNFTKLSGNRWHIPNTYHICIKYELPKKSDEVYSIFS